MKRWRVAAWSTAAGLAVLAVLAAALVPAYSARSGPPVSPEPVLGLPADGPAKAVYLTFDAGNAGDDTVAPLLDLLRAEDAGATFFLTGKWTLEHPRSARAIADAGHLLANHSSTHPHVPRLPGTLRRAEVVDAALVIERVTGTAPTPLYRPPHGDTTTTTQEALAALGYRTVMWTKDPHDWPLDGSVTRESILGRIGEVSDGDVICFHLRNIETVEALRVLLPRLRAQGFEFRQLPAAELCASAP